MNEIILILQALLLASGWALFLKAQQELKAQAAKQSLVGESENLRRSIELLLHKLVTEAERVEHQLMERIEEARKISVQPDNKTNETDSLHSAFVSTREDRYSGVYALADQGRTSEQIAREIGKLPGEVELILNLRNVHAHRTEGD